MLQPRSAHVFSAHPVWDDLGSQSGVHQLGLGHTYPPIVAGIVALQAPCVSQHLDHRSDAIVLTLWEVKVPAIERDQPVAGFSPADGFLFPVETHDGCCLDTGDPVCSEFFAFLSSFWPFLQRKTKNRWDIRIVTGSPLSRRPQVGCPV